MSFSLHFKKHSLNFSFPARTSRGALSHHNAYLLFLSNTSEATCLGVGECAPLAGLSPDYEDIESHLTDFCRTFNSGSLETFEECEKIASEINKGEQPSLAFALETALQDYKTGGNKLLYKSDFTAGNQGVPINGLIWMGETDWMKQQIREKLQAGFSCLKLKIGAIDFEQELALLTQLRREYPASELTIRVDANGAFSISDAEEKLKRLSELELHSIEQPIKPGNWEAMAKLCADTPVPIALDEELIGPQESNYKKRLLYFIKPQYIILKPTLVGGIASTQEWIRWAEHHSIGWWLTSALESNIGLNAIAQFAASTQNELPQGLGTGQLYTNNFPSPLTVEEGQLFHFPSRHWDLSSIVA